MGPIIPSIINDAAGNPAGGQSAPTTQPIVPDQPILTPADVGLPPGPTPIGPESIVPVSPTNPYLANPAPVAQVPVPVPVPVQEKSKVGVYHSGITDPGVRKAENLFGAYEKKADQVNARDASDIRNQQATIGAHYNDEAAAATKEGEINAAYEKANADLQARIAQQQAQFAEQYKQIEAKSEAVKASYLAKYDEDRAAVRALTAQSGNPLAKMSGMEMLGLASAEFAQGMLAMRGYNIDVTGRVDKWIEQSLKTHQQDIVNARANADDTMHLYDVARQSSRDQYEAFEKYRGLVMESLQTQLLVNASKFKSPLATAHAQATVAQIQVKADEARNKLADEAKARAIHQQQLQIQAAEGVARAAHETERNNIEWARLAAMKAKQPKAPPTPSVIQDPYDFKTDPKTGAVLTGGRGIGYLNDSAQGAREIQQQLAKAGASHARLVEDVRVLSRMLPKDKPVSQWIAKKNDPSVRKFFAKAGLILAQNIHDVSGAVASKEEVERQLEPMRLPSFWESGGPDTTKSLMNLMTSESRSIWNGQLKGAQAAGAILPFAPGENLSTYGLTPEGYARPLNGEFDVPGTQDLNANIASEFEGKKPEPAAGSASAAAVGVKGDTDRAVFRPSLAYSTLARKPDTEVPEWANHIDAVARHILHPDQAVLLNKSLGSELKETPKEAYDNNISLLEQLAAGKGGKETKEAQIYAKRVLELYKKDPSKLDSLLSTEAPGEYQPGNSIDVTNDPNDDYNEIKDVPDWAR